MYAVGTNKPVLGENTQPFDPVESFGRENLREAQLLEPELRRIIRHLGGNNEGLTPTEGDKYIIDEGVLFFLGPGKNEQMYQRIMVPTPYHKRALTIAHDSIAAGHFGTIRTLVRARNVFYWPNMAKDVKSYVNNCVPCQRKRSLIPTNAPIQSFPLAKYPLHRIGIDLIGEHSPSYSGKKYILTIVCHYSRHVQAYSLHNKKSETVGEAILDYVCRYGCPDHIVSDRGGEFTSQLFQELATQLKIKLHFTTAYNPIANGLTEAFNKTIKNTLHHLLLDDVHTWDVQLKFAILAMNSSFHPSVQNTPYYLFHGRDVSP